MKKNSIFVLFLLIGFFLSTSVDCFAQRKTGKSNARTRASVSTKNSAAPVRRPKTFEAAITQADVLLQKGDYVKSLAVAQQAIEMNSEDYRGYYYASYSSFKRDLFDEAESLVEKAKMRATPEGKADIDRLIEDIANGKVGVEQLQEAERYLNDGNSEQAAATFSKAFETMPYREDIGFKAVRLYSDQLSKPKESVRILKQILLRAQSPDSTKTASAMLEKAETAVGTAEERRAAEERRLAEERRAAEKERQREEADRAERERKETAEREKQALERKRTEIEEERVSVEGKIDSETSAAEREEESAQHYANEEAKYSGMQYGQISASIASIAKDRAKSKAKRHRNQVRELQSKLREMERQLTSIERDLSRLSY